MNATRLDPRYPEQYLTAVNPDCPAAARERAVELGKRYRETKKLLKTQSEKKKRLSKQVALARSQRQDPEPHVAAVKTLSAQINETKYALKQLEADVTSLTAANQMPEPAALPPPFLPRHRGADTDPPESPGVIRNQRGGNRPLDQWK